MDATKQNGSLDPQQPDREQNPIEVEAINCNRSSFSIEDTIPWSHIQTRNSLFNPTDPWAVNTRAGLMQLNDWNGMRVLEVGIGTGITTGLVLREKSTISVLFGTDLDPEAARVTTENVATIAPDSVDKFIALEGSHDLLSGFLASSHSTEKLDRVFGCIPQMLAPREGFTPPVDALAHYLRPQDVTGIPTIDQHGLALNARLLEQAHDALVPDGSVVLTISGRPPWGVVELMFAHTGFESPTKIHSALIPQDPGTSVEQLATLERDLEHLGVRFEFWGADDTTPINGEDSPLMVKTDREPMNAREASISLRAGRPVYHELHVAEGKKQERTNE